MNATPAIQYSSILLPTAFSELSKRAAAHAAYLAKSLGATIHVVHVASPGVPPPVDAASGAPYPAVAMPDPSLLVEHGRASLAEFVRSNLTGLEVKTECTIGNAPHELAEYASRNRIDLIVMGTHADGVVKRLIFGSVSKSLLECSPCPILFVPVHGVSHL
ncbi:MAG: universal stress protein [Phycisphaerales bacterium]|nr:MAG: universal stress protein [Phycisphaerales bacterium]